MKRSSQQVSDTAARRLFINSLPAEWIAREQSDDYGIDYEIEVFLQNQSTGIIFKVQLKGNQTVSTVDAKVAQSIPLKNLLYYLDEVRIPVFIIIADLATSNVYWHSVQTDSDLREGARAAQAAQQNSLTIHALASHTLPDSAGLLVQEQIKCSLLLSTQNLAQASRASFFEALKHIKVSESLIHSLQEKTDATKLELAFAKLIEGDFATVIHLIDRVLSSPETSVETKFQGLLYKEDALVKLKLHDPVNRDEAMTKIPLLFAQKMRELAADGPMPLRLFAIAAKRIATFHDLVNNEFSLFISLRVQPKDQDPFILFGLVAHRAMLVRRIHILYKHCWRLFHYCVSHHQLNLIPELIHRLVPGLNILFLRLRNDDLNASYLALRGDCLPLIEAGFHISLGFGDFDRAASLATEALLLLDPDNPKDFHAAFGVIAGWIARIEDDAVKSSIQRRLDNLADKIRKDHVKAQMQSEIPIEKEQEIYRRMAVAMGINIDDPDDRIAHIVNIGLRDLNPERVLRDCKHLYVIATGGGVPAKMLNLPTAGFKRLHCLAKSIAIEGLDLDDVYHSFQSTYCTGCDLVEPHPKDWIWNRKWQKEQDEQHFKKQGLRHSD